MNKFKIIVVLLLCGLLMSCGTGRKSIKAESGLSPQEQRKFDYFFLEALRMNSLEKEDAAFDLLKRAAEIDTASAVVQYELSTYYLQVGQTEKAYNSLHAAAEKEKDNFWYNTLYARLASRLGQYDEAIRVYKRLVAQNPGKPEINYSLAEAYVNKGDFKEAIACYDRLEESMGKMDLITAQKMALYHKAGDEKSVIAEAEKLVAAYPRNIAYMMLLADVYIEAGRDSDVLELYKKAEEEDPNNGYLLLSRAGYYEKKGDIEAYEAEIHNALLNMNLDIETKLRIFTTYISDKLQKKENLDQIEPLFKEMLEIYPQEESVHKLYASYLLSRQEFDKAKEQLSVAVDLNPANIESWMQLMGIAMNRKDFSSVVETGKRALTYLPEEKDLYLYTSVGYSQTGSYDEAAALLEKGLGYVAKEDVNTISDFYGQLGDVYHSAGKPEKAYEAYEKALEYNSRNVGVLNNYSYYLSLEKKDLQKAERMSAETVKAEPINATFLVLMPGYFFQQGNYTLAKLYMESAMSKTKEESPDMLEHYGDILAKLGQMEEAVENWKKSKEAGNESPVLKKKIELKKYIEP